MAKRLTDTDIWDKEWFMKLSPKLKCLVKFVRDKCDLAGVWNPNWELAKIYIGDVVTEKELIEIDNGQQFAKLGNGKIFCIDFINFQNGKLSNKSPIHIKILSLLENHGIPYPYPINTLLNRGIVIVDVVVKEKEAEILNSFSWIENNSRNNKIDVNFCTKCLKEFIKIESLKSDWGTKSIADTKDHFVNWLPIYLKKRVEVNTTGRNLSGIDPN